MQATTKTRSRKRGQKRLFKPPPRSDFANLVRIEPRLAALEREAAAVGRLRPTGPVDETAWQPIRHELESIIPTTERRFDIARRALRFAFLLGRTEAQPLRQVWPWEIKGREAAA